MKSIREHFQTAYGTTGGKFEDYASAYRYGSSAAADERFRGHNSNDSEEDVHADSDSRYGAATPWEKAKNAVRYGWEKPPAKSRLLNNAFPSRADRANRFRPDFFADPSSARRLVEPPFLG